MTGPDGKTYSIDGPAGATAQAVQQQLAQQYDQANAPKPSPQDQANAAGQDSGANESPVMAAIGQAAHQGTFGLNDYINAGARYAAQRLTGVKNPDDYSTDVAYSRGKSQGEATASPIASTVGGVAGALLGGGAIAKGLSAAKTLPGVGRVIDALAPIANKPISNISKSVGINGLIGAGQSAANGDDQPTIGRNAVISSIVGPVVGKVAGAVASRVEPYIAGKLTPAIQKLVPSFNPDNLSGTSLASLNTLATTLGVSNKDMAAAYDSHKLLTGALPSIAQITDIAQQGKLKALAAANPEIGQAAITAAQAGNAPLDVQLKQAASDRANLASQGMPGRPQTSQGLLSARDQAMDVMMNSKSPAGVALRDEPISDPTGVLSQPHVAYSLQPDTQMNARLGQPNPVLENIRNGNATVGDLDTVRKALRGTQADLMRPNPSGGSAQNPLGAKEFGNVANQVEGLATSQHPDYGTAISGYRQLGRYETGFNHGIAGNDFHDAPDDFTRQDLDHPSGIGKEGYAHGNALYNGQRALDAIAPSTVKDGTQPGLGTVAAAAHTIAAPSLLSVANLSNHLQGLSLSKSVAPVVAKQLFSNDPVVVKQGIANLGRAKVSSQDIARLGAAIGGTAAAGINQYLNGQ